MAMRASVYLLLLGTVGCVPTQLVPDEAPTPQVAVNPFAGPAPPMPVRVNLPPANHEIAAQVELIRGKLVGENLEKTGLRPNVITLAAPQPEVFHVGLSQIYITEAMVRQCQTEGQLAAVLAHEMGRMVAEREASVSDQVRYPERLPPIALPIGVVGHPIDNDPHHQIELARFEKQFPRQGKKLARPNPHAIARAVLERAGYSRTELDAALPLLQATERSTALEDQFKGTPKQSEWQAR
jgi:predicted Zn-dependent protease